MSLLRGQFRGIHCCQWHVASNVRKPIKLPQFSALKDVAHELTSFLRGSCVREDDFKYGCCCRSKATSDGPGAAVHETKQR